MRETQRNIQAYRKRLVGVKEKLATAGLLFLMSAVMLTTASFAWITLSVAPEISNISTTITGNGNLEIIMATSDENGSLANPAESQVGDGAIQDIFIRNTTWGNLINLNDKRYGVEKAILKPSVLNDEAEIKNSPLQAVYYSGDGRILKKNSKFKYTSYNDQLNSGEGDFEFLPNYTKYGVRAISSVVSGTDNTESLAKYESLKNSLDEVGEVYINTFEEHKTVISNLLGIYVTDQANQMLADDKSPLDYSSSVPGIIELMDKFLICLDNTFEMYDEFAHAQYEARYKTVDEEDKPPFPYIEIEDLKTKSEEELEAILPAMEGLKELIEIYNRTTENRASLQNKLDESNGGTILWDDISSEIDALVNISTCKINGMYISELDPDDATDLLALLKEKDPSKNIGEITGGDIKNYEQLIGARISLQVSIPIDLTRVKSNSLISTGLFLMGITGNKTNAVATVVTDAEPPFTAVETIESILIILNDGNPPVWFAEDTYGLVIDFWLRTNANDSYVILEGEPIVQSMVDTVMADGEEYVLFYNEVDGNTYYYVPDDNTSNQYTKERIIAEGISQEEINILKTYGEFVNNSTGQTVSFEPERTFLDYATLTYDADQMVLYVSKVDNATIYGYSIDDSEYHELVFDGDRASISIEDDTETVTVVASSSSEYWPSTVLWEKATPNEIFTQPVEPTELNRTRPYFVENLQYAEKSVVIGYDGANRVWQESTAISENATTQGNGSCYTFHPSGPVEQEQMLQLLRGLSVAFIDDNYQILGSAVLNVDKAFEENGKVTVPLELDPDSNYSTYQQVGEDKILVLTSLNKGEAKFISAIVYIDGGKISNKDVSATTDITGNLNIQFGSTAELNNVENDSLKNEVYNISAGMNNNGSSELEFNFDANNLPSTSLQVSVDGVSPTEVKANFSRIVNGTQGVRGEDIVFQFNPDTGLWEGTVTFDRPGNYVLRSVWLDGIEYELTDNKKLSVDILGFKIIDITWEEKSSNIYHMSSDYTYIAKGDMTVHFASDNTYIPQKVQGLFRKLGDSTYTTVNFSNNGDMTWSGIAAFTSSGTYVLETLMIDNEAHTVETVFQKTATLYLGIKAQVEINDGNSTFVYEGEPITASISVTIKDDKNQLMSDLSNVFLRYNKVGSIKPLFAELKWNKNTESFEGEFLVSEPGKYEFFSIGINKTVADVNDVEQMLNLSSYLLSADAPVLSLLPKDPPEYSSFEVDEVQYRPNDDASIDVSIKNSSAAIGAAVMYHDETDSTYIVNISNNDKNSNADGSVTTWKVRIPKLNNSSQNGTWTLQKFYLSDVYVNGETYQFEGDEGNDTSRWVEANNTVSDKDFIVLSLSDNITAYVVNDFRVVVENQYANPSTKDPFDKVEFTATINNPYERTSKITITDYWSNPEYASTYLKEIDAKLTYTYSKVDWWTNADSIASDSVAIYDSDLTATSLFPYAGTYTPTLQLTLTDINGDTYSHSITGTGNPELIGTTTTSIAFVSKFIEVETVEWYQPDVMFTEVSPNGSHWVSSDWHDDYNILTGSKIVASLTGKKNNLIVDYDENLGGGHHLEVWFNAVSNEYHKHNDSICLQCDIGKNHVHTSACYDSVGNQKTPGNGSNPPSHLDGKIYEFTYRVLFWSVTEKYISINNQWYEYNGSVSGGETVAVNINTCEAAHIHVDSCYSCNNSPLNTFDFVRLESSKVKAKIIYAGEFNSASITIDSANEDVTFSFTPSKLTTDYVNVGYINTDMEDKRYPVVGDSSTGKYLGAKGKILNVKLSDGNEYSFELFKYLTINENEGSADGYY